jgi:hypothetical protein
MNLTQFSADDLQRITEIVRKKEEHLRAASAYDIELAQIGVVGLPAQSPNGVTPKPIPQLKVHGSLHAHRFAVLKELGPAGATTREFAQLAGHDIRAIGTWLSAQKAVNPQVKRRADGRWYYKEAGGLVTETPRSEEPKPKPKAPRGQTREVILATLRRAGPTGLTISAIVQQTDFTRSRASSAIHNAIIAGEPVKRIGEGLYAYTGPK